MEKQFEYYKNYPKKYCSLKCVYKDRKNKYPKQFKK